MPDSKRKKADELKSRVDTAKRLKLTDIRTAFKLPRSESDASSIDLTDNSSLLLHIIHLLLISPPIRIMKIHRKPQSLMLKFMQL